MTAFSTSWESSQQRHPRFLTFVVGLKDCPNITLHVWRTLETRGLDSTVEVRAHTIHVTLSRVIDARENGGGDVL